MGHSKLLPDCFGRQMYSCGLWNREKNKKHSNSSREKQTQLYRYSFDCPDSHTPFYPGHGKLIPLQKLKDSYEKTKEAFIFHN